MSYYAPSKGAQKVVSQLAKLAYRRYKVPVLAAITRGRQAVQPYIKHLKKAGRVYNLARIPYNAVRQAGGYELRASLPYAPYIPQYFLRKPYKRWRYYGSQQYRNRLARRRFKQTPYKRYKPRWRYRRKWPYRRRYLRTYKRRNYKRRYSYYNSLYRTYNRRYQIRKTNRYK